MRHQAPRCPRCDGRLFLETEFPGILARSPIYYWSCDLGCSREWTLDLEPRARESFGALVEMKRVEVVV